MIKNGYETKIILEVEDDTDIPSTYFQEYQHTLYTAVAGISTLQPQEKINEQVEDFAVKAFSDLLKKMRNSNEN